MNSIKSFLFLVAISITLSQIAIAENNNPPPLSDLKRQIWKSNGLDISSLWHDEELTEEQIRQSYKTLLQLKRKFVEDLPRISITLGTGYSIETWLGTYRIPFDATAKEIEIFLENNARTQLTENIRAMKGFGSKGLDDSVGLEEISVTQFDEIADFSQRDSIFETFANVSTALSKYSAESSIRDIYSGANSYKLRLTKDITKLEYQVEQDGRTTIRIFVRVGASVKEVEKLLANNPFKQK